MRDTFGIKTESFSLCDMLSHLKHVDRRLTALLLLPPEQPLFSSEGGGLLLRTRVIWVGRGDTELKEVALDKVNVENIVNGVIIPYIEHGSKCDITFEDLNEENNDDNQAVMYVGAQGFNNFHAYSRAAFDRFGPNTGSRFVTDPSTRENMWRDGRYDANRLIDVGILNSGWNKFRGFEYPVPAARGDGKIVYPTSNEVLDCIDKICIGISVKYYFGISDSDSAESRREKLPSRAFLDLAVLMETCPPQPYTGKCACAIPRVTLSSGSEAVIAHIPAETVVIELYQGVNWDDHNYIVFTRDAITAYLYGNAHYSCVTHVQRVDEQNNVKSASTDDMYECYYFKIHDASVFYVPVYMRLTKVVDGEGNISWSLRRLEGVVESEFKPGMVNRTLDPQRN